MNLIIHDLDGNLETMAVHFIMNTIIEYFDIILIIVENVKKMLKVPQNGLSKEMANLVVAINVKHTSGFGERHTDLVRKKFFRRL